ncbi:hypothetical protein SeMB42_g04618 [Synchytrium endobioticum]|uniref:Palmitoyltransferase n=1 Tax=Synchytrium endobioticum TaxID=286115 RepID=A0A507D8T2_9FUNG|nr:hypothetical protein SeMB42_g04618 [Synchytrium endobioticum]TPX47904.1 hypothetical protein SeLEV6574_g02364 [Synchytrium endobioticum]
MSDPGRVSPKWHTILDTHNHNDESVSLKMSIHELNRYCKTCEEYKPPRAHHCSQCHRCVLRMDHHCPFTNSCIGFYNHAHFVRFLIWTSIGCLMVAIIIIWRLAEIVAAVEMGTTQTMTSIAIDAEIVFIGIDLVILMPIASIIWLLLSTHVYYVLTNQTTIEASERRRKNFLVGTRLKTETNLYDVGFRKNVISVFGHLWMHWLIPTLKTPPGDGHGFDMKGGDH